ncbi:hypothetical protein BJV82DRAFT_628544, partial [Fennellomyces sp. T-0311]
MGCRTVPKPSAMTRALRVKLKWEALAQLRETDAKLREENKLLMKEVAEKADRQAAIKTNINSIFSQYEETIDAAMHIPTDELEHLVERL